MRKRVITSALFLICAALFVSPLRAEEKAKQGGLSLAFDDGYPSWMTITAPELRKVGGMATGFVNNQRILNRYISFDDLNTLRDAFGWEIGTHTYHHYRAPEFAKKKGLTAWTTEELNASLAELRGKGIKIVSMAFPFNDSDPIVEKEVLKAGLSFRKVSSSPFAGTSASRGYYPAASIEISHYVPIELARQWIDFAASQDRVIFLYGHEVMSDESFISGTVEEAEGNILKVAGIEGTLQKNGDLCLVPDVRRRIYGAPIKVSLIEKDRITASRNDLQSLAKPGSSFLAGPCYGVPLSYFRLLVGYAAEKLRFYSVEEAVARSSSASK